MDETKLTAHLPLFDMEIVRREEPDADFEAITVHLRAPSFDAVGLMLGANPASWANPW